MCCYSIVFSFQSLLSVFYKFSFFISIVVNISSYIRLWVGYLNYLYHFIVENVFRDTLFLNRKKIKWTFVNSSLQIILHRRKRRVKTIFMMKSTLYLFGHRYAHFQETLGSVFYDDGKKALYCAGYLFSF